MLWCLTPCRGIFFFQYIISLCILGDNAVPSSFIFLWVRATLGPSVHPVGAPVRSSQHHPGRVLPEKRHHKIGGGRIRTSRPCLRPIILTAYVILCQIHMHTASGSSEWWCLICGYVIKSILKYSFVILTFSSPFWKGGDKGQTWVYTKSLMNKKMVVSNMATLSYLFSHILTKNWLF